MDKDAQGAPPAKNESRQAAAGAALMDGEIEIMIGRPLPHLDKGPVKAYAARQRGESAENMFAMICEPHLVPRSAEAPSYSAIAKPAVTRLVSSGPVFWPPAAAARFCFVFQNNLGRPIIEMAGEEQGLGWRQDHVLKSVIRPLVEVLGDLHRAGIVHGNIRLDNIFDGGGKNPEHVILGECLSTPPSYTQPILYETVERSMFDPIGKGPGLFADDIYALGASLAIIMRRKDPMQGRTPDEIIDEKLNQGSYNTLLGKERITGPLLEFLRGLLYDDRDQRWTLAEILTWLEGQHLGSKQSTKRRRIAARPLLFNGQSYERQNLLARDLNKNLSEAMQLIDGGDLEQWIARSLEDSDLKERFDSAIESAREFGRGTGYPERLVNRVSIALDPEGPVRYKGMNLHPLGFSYALAEAVALKKDLAPFVEMISQLAVMYWLTEQVDMKVDTSASISIFDSCRSFVRHNNMGYGIERCLYFLDPEIPCLSDRLRKYYVRTPEDMLYAFEVIAKAPGRPELFIDRHVAAFLSVKDRKVIDVYSADLGAPEAARRILANLKVLATVQQRAKMELFPGLSAWFVDIIAPLYGRFHDRELCDRLRKKVDKLKNKGDLVQITLLFDDYETLLNDFNAFQAAMEEYALLRQEEALIESQIEKPELLSSAPGRRAASIVSSVLSAIIIIGFGMMFFLRKGLS
jgi:eukaryotic-like serine/threonine-protein kinase